MAGSAPLGVASQLVRLASREQSFREIKPLVELINLRRLLSKRLSHFVP